MEIFTPEYFRAMSLIIIPVIIVWTLYWLQSNRKNTHIFNKKKKNMKFKIWNRELEFDINIQEIIFNKKVFKPSVRTFWDMQNLYMWDFDKNISKDKPLYFMYRDVFFGEADKILLDDNNIRFDITIILPFEFWWELSKTYGHYHPKNPNWKYYQELYQVLSWEAVYLQQNNEKVFFTKAKSREAVNMDESFGHITINPSKNNLLVMANLVDKNFSSIYNDYETKKGWNYYLYEDSWRKNENYDSNIKLEESDKKFQVDISIYDDFLNNPEKFNYLH